MYRIPGEDAVKDAVQKVLRRHTEVRSQALFQVLVLRELRGSDGHYSLSGERLRRIVADMPGAKILVEKMRGRREAKRCYVCGGRLQPTKTKNLLGEDVMHGKRCKRCGFSIDRENMLPRKYVFCRV